MHSHDFKVAFIFKLWLVCFFFENENIVYFSYHQKLFESLQQSLKHPYSSTPTKLARLPISILFCIKTVFPDHSFILTSVFFTHSNGLKCAKISNTCKLSSHCNPIHSRLEKAWRILESFEKPLILQD